MQSSADTILLVEDDFVLRTGLAQLFEGQGYVVHCAANGLEAFHQLTNETVKPAIIVLDLMMPYMDGIEFLAMQRAMPSIADLPVVVITANARVAVEAECLDVKRTLYKPVNTHQLLETVKEMIPSAPIATC